MFKGFLCDKTFVHLSVCVGTFVTLNAVLVGVLSSSLCSFACTAISPTL